MNCVICKTGELAPGHATVTLEREGAIVIVKGVPAQVCQQCGEYYLDEETSSRLFAQAGRALEGNAELEVLRYAA